MLCLNDHKLYLAHVGLKKHVVICFFKKFFINYNHAISNYTDMIESYYLHTGRSHNDIKNSSHHCFIVQLNASAILLK